MKEIWTPAKYSCENGKSFDFTGYYEVSNLGRVKSIFYNNKLILKPIEDNYLRVNLYKDKIQKQFLVHKLVWVSFNGEVPNGYQINHINEITHDNRLTNLNLMTAKQNTNWGTKIKRVSEKNTNGKLSKIVLQYDLEGNLIKEWPSVREVVRVLGYSHGNISKCCTGKRKYSHNCVWKYKN